MADEEVDRGVGRAVLGKAQAVALENRAGARVGVHMPVPGGVHLRPHPTRSEAAHVRYAWQQEEESSKHQQTLPARLQYILWKSLHPGCLGSLYAIRIGGAVAADCHPTLHVHIVELKEDHSALP